MTSTTVANDVDPGLLIRVYREYTDLPGLSLTLTQASRLWGSDEAESRQVLDELVARAVLRRSGAHYVRADSWSSGE
jgi:hypothetical protein